MERELQIPDGVGPHEEKELELLLAGKKPAAKFCDIIPASFDWGEKDFEPYVQVGRLVKREWIFEKDGYTSRFIYFALPHKKDHIDKLYEIDRSYIDGPQKNETEMDEDDILTGQLLGYSEEEISIFLQWKRTYKKIKNAPL